MINKRVLVVDETFNFLIGIVDNIVGNKISIKTKKNGTWLIQTVPDYTVHELNFFNLLEIEGSRLNFISKKCKQLEIEIHDINQKIIKISNKKNEYIQINVKNPSYEIEQYIKKLEEKQEKNKKLLEDKTSEYIITKQDLEFKSRLENVKEFLNNSL